MKMTREEYLDKRQKLVEVFHDAEDRGDYNLEMDTKEALIELSEKFFGQGEEE